MTTETDDRSSLLACNTHGVRLTAEVDERCEDCRPLADEPPLTPWPGVGDPS